MKYLSDYTNEAQSKLFEELGVFFAFTDEQFDEGAEKYAHLKPEGTKWASLGAGMYMPKVNVDEFIKRHDSLVKEAIKLDLSENGREGVLQREMGNYEVGYSGMDENFHDAIRDYGFSEEEILEQYKIHMENNEY